MSESGSARGLGSGPAALGTSLLDAHDHTRLWLQSKLSGDWSAQAGGSGLTEERLNALTRCFGTLDSMVKVRLLLAGLFVPRMERGRLQPLLGELASQAAGNQDEWVRATAAVVGDFSGLLDMRALMAQFPLVRESVQRFSVQLGELRTPPSLLPQTEQYMHMDISRLPAPAPAATATEAGAGGSAVRPHFRLRETPQGAAGETGQSASGPIGCGGGGLAGSGIGGGGGSGMLLASLGSVGGSGSGSLAGLESSRPLTGVGSYISVPGGPGGDSFGPRRGLGPGGSGGGETSMLRSRAAVSHSSKEPKQGPPTPSGKGVTGGPALAMRLSRSRSLVSAPGEQLPGVPESPQAGGAASTPYTTSTAAAAATTAAGAAAPLAAALTTTTAAVIPAGHNHAHHPAVIVVPVSPGFTPLPTLQVAAASAVSGGGAQMARDSQSQQSTPRGSSWQGNPAVDAQQYPLAAAIAIAVAAAASGDPQLAGASLGPFHAGSTAGELPYALQHPLPYCNSQDSHASRSLRVQSHEPQGSMQDKNGEVYDDGHGNGKDRPDEQMFGRRSSPSVERMYPGAAVAKQWSAGDSGDGRHAEGNMQQQQQQQLIAAAGEEEGFGEPDSKRPRAIE